jgi:hypothetical protein
MRLNAVYDPEVRPEAQMSLKAIPSAGRVDHPELKAALGAYEKAREAEQESRRAHTQAEQELPAAEYNDEVALADAREKRKADPGPVNAERQQKAIAEAKRDWGARKIAVGRAVEAVVTAFEEHGDAWVASLDDQRNEIRKAMAVKLDEWSGLWARLQVNVANRAAVEGRVAQSPAVFASSFRVPLVRDGSVIEVADVLDGLRGLGAPTEPEPEAKPEPRHTPPSRHPFASAGAQTVALG